VVLQVLYTEAQQQEALINLLIKMYLSTKRGQYVDRNENLLPMLHRVDLSVTQDFSLNSVKE
jgi:hypothetical protein